MQDESEIDWNIELNFDLATAKPAPAAPPPPPKKPAREVLQEKFPRIMDKIELLWGSLALHQYLQETLLTDRANRQGFPPDVMEALGQINNEHQRALHNAGLLRQDVWDMQMRGK